MKLDRTKFVALTVSLLGVGCATTTDGEDEGAVGSEEQEATSCIAASAVADTGSCKAIAKSEVGDGEDDSFVQGRCEAFVRLMKPATARYAKRCLSGRKMWTGYLTPSDAYACGREALRRTCVDTTADLHCQTIVRTAERRGRPTTLAECRQYLSGLSSAGRKAALSCVVHQPRFFGLYSCVEGLN